MSIPKIASDASKEAFNIFKVYSDLLLPIDEKSGKLKEMTREERIKIRDNLRELNNKLKASPPKSKPKRPKSE